MKTVRGAWRYVRAVAPEAARTPLDPVYARKSRDVELFALTIGYNRSGSSMLGQLLNAHPEIALAHELSMFEILRALRFIPTPSARGRLTRMVVESDREFARDSYSQSGYSYAVNGLWQGRYSRLRVIGNKGSVNTVAGLNAAWGAKTLDYVVRRARLPARFLFTVRNPYDMIASRTLHSMRGRAGSDIPPPRAYDPAEDDRMDAADEAVRFFLRLSERLSRVLPAIPKEDAFETRCEDFIASPKENLRRICAFLGVSEDEDHLDACAAFTFPTQSPARLKVRWTDAQLAQVADAIEKYPWLAGYDFDS